MKANHFVTTAFTLHSSFRELASRYNAFILDQYGVLHNGREPLPGVLEVLKDLHKSKHKLVILSNTSSPASSSLKKLQKMGFDLEWFTEGAVTSGEVASGYIHRTYGRDLQGQMPKKAMFLTYQPGFFAPPPQEFLNQCGSIEMSTSLEETDLIIAHGGEIWYRGVSESSISLVDFMSKASFEVLGPILEACYKRQVPMICANPDFMARFADNSIGYMPGTMARYYEDMGGKVTYFGKPYPEHFEASLQKLGIDKSKVAHVGDSLYHDIAGANAAGIDSVFVSSGIHADELNISYGESPNLDALKKLFEKEKVSPTHVVSAFSYSNF
jgi:ribonucleotide monophosphatase NagD (HAD superfamily)